MGFRENDSHFNTKVKIRSDFETLFVPENQKGKLIQYMKGCDSYTSLSS